MRRKPASRLLALVLALVMVLGLLPGASAAGLVWRETDLTVSLDQSHRLVTQTEQPEPYGPTDTVRVSIVLEDAPTAGAGFATRGIAMDQEAIAYDRALNQTQKAMEQTISAQALEGKKLDVVWNLTLVANIISANVPYGSLDAIRAVPGVREVQIERQYSPNTTAEPQTYASGGMTGATTVWQSGYTGAGSRIAIVDTGTDTDHQSFDNGAFLHALEQNAAGRGISYEQYLQELDLLDAGDVSRVLSQLNVTERIGAGAESYYLSEKLPFAANYVDRNLVVDHDHDNASSHGSHVAGIAAANRYIPSPKGGSYVDALSEVSAAGAAPDAQIITMKVFGNAAGPYDSDYFAAVEDAIWLGCDSVNLSLGMPNPGNSYTQAFDDLLEFLETTDTVVVMSAGNAGQWAKQTSNGALYSDGVSFHTAGEPGTYTNTLAVASVDSDGSGKEQRDDYTVSSFSSWGVPGSLELKPEIAAPGGGIWSVNGMDTSGKGYEYQSGTSMAAPQISGMTAQLAQYIREQELEDKTGLSTRQLAQSLLMSTAVPLRETAAGGTYYSLLAQGAGFGRVDLAAAAESYVLVEGQSDGKVKVELGEDAQRTGEYTFSFTLNNLTGDPVTYELRADLFTQKLEGDYLSSATRDLPVRAVFTSGGKSLASLGGSGWDLNGDGAANADDAGHLLEYLLGNVTGLSGNGDVSGDGQVNSYDAHLLLAMEPDGYEVTLEPNGSAQIEVTLTLTDETRAILEGEYPAGAYIEAFVYAESAEGVTHSIPVLGYYGSWTDPGMYDVGGWVEQNAGAETRTPYLYQLLGNQSNYISADRGDGREHLYGGNPYVREDEYLPRRNAFNNQRGYTLQTLRFSLIRNAYDTRLTLEDKGTGELLVSESMGAYGAAYYNANSGYWSNTQYGMALGLNLEGIPENTTLELRLEAAPELYRTESGAVDWTKVENGGVLSFPITIDNTAPQVLSIRQEGSTLAVRAKDNQYITAVALMNAAGTGTLAMVPGNQLTANTAVEAELDLSAVYGTKFLVAVCDYAENVTVCEVELEQVTQRPRFTAADQNTGSWYGLGGDGTRIRLTEGDAAIQAAEYVDGYVFRVDGQNRLWVGSDGDLYGTRLLSELDPEGNIITFTDLAYSTLDRTLYGSFYAESNGMEMPYLCVIDIYTGEMAVLGEMAVDAPFMTIDDAGNFYAVGYGVSQLYTFRGDHVSTGKYTAVGRLDGYASTSAAPLAWDHGTDELFWAQTGSHGTNLLQVDPDTAAVTLCAVFEDVLTGLYIAGSTVGDTFAPTEKVSSVTMPAAAQTIVGGQVQLSAQVLPWNLRDDSVTWSSGNTKVATVDANGLVTGVSGGTAVITAVSRLDSSKKASCTVTVNELDSSLKGIVWDEEGYVSFAAIDPGSLPEYQQLALVNEPLATTASLNGILYAGTAPDEAGVSDLYRVDPKTFALTKVGGSYAISYADLCGAPTLGYLAATYYGYLALVDPATGEYLGAFDWNGYVPGDLVGITHLGTEYNQNYGEWMDVFLLLDNQGNVYREAVMPYNGSFATFQAPGADCLGNMGAAVDSSKFQGFHFDGSYLYWARFSEADNLVELRMMDVLGSGAVYSLGYFPEGVWPVGGLYTDAQLGSNALTAEFAQMTVETQCFTESVEPAAAGGLNSIQSAASAGADETVSVEVTYDRAVTNGILRVEYDTDKLVFAGLEHQTHAGAYRLEPGAVEVAFAHSGAVAAGEAVARLTFRVKEGVLGGETAVTVRTRELGQEDVELSQVLNVTIPLPHNPFVDVPAGSYYHIPVLWALQKGITSGVDATHFGSGQSCTRAQVVTFLYSAAGKPAVSGTNPFTDVPAGSWYEKAVIWAVQNGITSGTDATHFSPQQECTRAQVVTFLYSAKGRPAVSGGNPFTDVPAGAWFEKPVIWAKENGITSGVSATEFGANAVCTRAQVVTFLYKAFGA